MSFCGFHTWNINTVHSFLSFTSQNTILLFTSCDWCPLLPYDTFKNLFSTQLHCCPIYVCNINEIKVGPTWCQYMTFSFKKKRSGFSHILVNYETALTSYNLWTGSYTYRRICIYILFYGSVFTPAQHRYYLRNCYTVINNRTFIGRAVREIEMATSVTKRSIT